VIGENFNEFIDFAMKVTTGVVTYVVALYLVAPKVILSPAISGLRGLAKRR
jgi:hypothetical protein